VPPIILSRPFKRELARKPHPLQAAILECVQRLGENTRHPSLQTHPVRGNPGVFEAYVDMANRVTFHYEAGTIVMRKHCNHSILRRP
jgi:hypothetical protein